MRVEVLLAKPQHFLQPRIVRAHGAVGGGRRELRVEQRPERPVAVDAPFVREPVVDEARFALFGDQARVLEQPQVPGHARLRDAEDAGELGDVEAILREHAQQPQPRGVAEQPKQGGCLLHRIYKSTYIDTVPSIPRASPGPDGRPFACEHEDIWLSDF